MEIMPKKIEERAGGKHMFSSQVSSKLLCSAFCSVISTPVNILPSSLGIMSLIVHARYVFWMVSGELAETVSTCSGHLPRPVGHFMYPRRRRATSYTFTLFALLQKFKWHHKKAEGVEKASPCTEPLSTVISVFPFCSLMQKKEIRPPFYGFSFGVPVCACVCAAQIRVG